MHPIEAFVRNPVKVAVGVLLVMLFGVIALLRMPMQLTPEVQTPTITVSTSWPGASPQEVEREIVREQEEELQSVEGVTKMSSECTDSSGRITMEFLVGSDMEEALIKVNSRLQQVADYPEDAKEPIISTSNSADRPIAWFILTVRPTETEKIRQLQEETKATNPQLAADLELVLLAGNPSSGQPAFGARGHERTRKRETCCRRRSTFPSNASSQSRTSSSCWNAWRESLTVMSTAAKNRN